MAAGSKPAATNLLEVRRSFRLDHDEEEGRKTITALETAPFRLSDQPLKTELLAKYFRGFGDPTRLRILELLRERERSVNELVELLETSQSKISNHLACLRWCGFVETRREHRTIYYRVADKRVSQMLELARGLLEDNAEHVAACRSIDG
jgi:DNA-binding transcriptional ArsR family regulator